MSVERIASEWAARERNPVAAMATLPEGVRMTAMPQAWIPVEERLPEPDYMGNPVGVLACLPGGEVCIGFCDDDEYGVRWDCQSTKKPTHWMPLPAPPEVK